MSIRIGFIGFGLSARTFHAPFIANDPGYTIVAAFERKEEESARLYPSTLVVRSLEEILSADVELVIITTPNDTHFPYAEQALKAGKHVVLEKPFTINSDDAQQLIGLARETNRILSVYHNRRYVSDFLTVREILERGLLGEVHQYSAHYDRYRPGPKPNTWREADGPGTGILYDLAPHLLDQALLLFGLPLRISADLQLQRSHAKAVDYFDLRLEYASLRVQLRAGMLVREPGPRFLIHGMRGSYHKYGEDPQEAALKSGQQPGGPGWGMEPADNQSWIYLDDNGESRRTAYPISAGNFGQYYRNLYEAIREGRPLSEKGEHGYNTIRLIEKAIESNREQRTITLDAHEFFSYD